MPEDPALRREILLAFWKVHILHHAAEGTIYGQGILEELRHHGYSVSPGTIYPLLKRMHAMEDRILTRLGVGAVFAPRKADRRMTRRTNVR